MYIYFLKIVQWSRSRFIRILVNIKVPNKFEAFEYSVPFYRVKNIIYLFKKIYYGINNSKII